MRECSGKGPSVFECPGGTLWQEDCRETLARGLSYDYVFAVPPDYAELGFCPKKQADEYRSFLESVFSLLSPSSGVVTVALTDRMHGGLILPKHVTVIDIFSHLGYRYVSQKVWCKSYKINLFRLNYSLVMTFAKKRCSTRRYKPYMEDVWKAPIHRHKGFNFAIALEVVKRCILNFTSEGATVYDPFFGSGTTGIACMETKRQFIGSEISEEYCAVATDRIQQHQGTVGMFS